MGFDNECICNIQSLPGEYFCPVCRTLIIPSEALQSQCTHLFCKPCLAYVVATTHACPYDGYLVTEADSKPLVELNKSLAETIGKVQVYCLYNRSGCQWQGTLSDCINHCTGCSFGNSPVVCNRCGTQIVHRQVQEHAQTCPGLQPQGHVESTQVLPSTAVVQDANKDSSAAAALAASTVASTSASNVTTTSTMAITSSVSVPTIVSSVATATTALQPQNQGVAVAYPQAGVQGTTAEQWYQQQQQQQQQVHYQQYYQQYPAYDPYQQQYQQYSQYQQQAYQQYPQASMQAAPQQVIQSHQQAQVQMQPQTHVQPQQNVLAQPHVLPQQSVQAQPHVQPQQNVQSQPLIQPQQSVQAQPHLQPQQNVQAQPLVQSQQNVQTQSHAQPHPLPTAQPQTQAQLPAQGMLLQSQQPLVPQAQVQLQPQPQPVAHPQPHLQSHQLPHAPFTQAQNFQVQQAHHYVQPQVHPQASLGAVQGQHSHPQLQPYPQASHQQVHVQQNQSAVVPQQHLQSHIQHQQPQPQNLPRPLQQSQLQYHSQSQPQFQQTHVPPQPRPITQPLPQSQTPAQNLPQPQHPSAQGVTGYQSYQQPQSFSQLSPGVSQQRPIPPHQSSVPQNTLQTQLPAHQPQQIRAAQSHAPMQAQPYPPIQSHPLATFQSTISQPQPNYLTHHQPGQQVQQPAVAQPHSHALAQQQAPGHFPSTQLSQQSAILSQVSSHSQHLSRPQVQPYMLPQLGGPLVPGRPIVPNQAMPQQEQHSPANRIQSGVGQDSPNHKYMSKQQGSIQEPPQSLHSETLASLPHVAPRSGTDVSQMSVTGSDIKSALMDKPADYVSDNTNQVQQSETGKAQVDSNASETSKSTELISSIKIESDSKLLVDGETHIDDVKENTRAKAWKDGITMEKEKRVATSFVEGTENSHFSGTVEGEKEAQPTGVKQNEKLEGVNVDSSPNGPTPTHPMPRNSKLSEMGDQVRDGKGHNFSNAANNIIQVGQSRIQGQLQQDGLSHEKPFLQSVHDNSPSQIPPQHSGPVGHRGMHSAGSFIGQQMYPSQNIPSAFPSNIVDSAMGSQRSSGADRLFPQSMPQPGSMQERRMHLPFPSDVPMFDHKSAPGQPRPPVYSENLPYKAQGPVLEESYQPPWEKPPFGSTFASQKREETNSFPVQNPSHGPPSHFVGPRAMQVDPFVRPSREEPPHGAFDAPRGIMSRGHHFASEGQASRSGHPNVFENTGYYNGGRQHESLGPLPAEHVAYGQQNILPEDLMKMNGMSNKGQSNLMHDLVFSHSVAEDTFRPLTFPKKGLRSAPSEKFGPFSADSGKHTVNPRMLEEGTGHFDGEGANRFNVHGPAGMPLERGQQQFGLGMPRLLDRTSRSELGPGFPPYQPGGRFPPVSGSSELGPLENEDRQKGPLFHENLGGKHEPIGHHSERLRQFSEFSRPHIDNHPPVKNAGIPDVQGPFSRNPDHLRREMNAFDSPHGHFNPVDRVGHGMLINNQGREAYGARNLPDHLRFGDSLRHGSFLGAEPTGFDGYGRRPFGDSSFPDSYHNHPVSLDVDSFENLNKRKHKSMGWCRLCMIDCETVEGLELHSQTKDHQNKAMEIVLSIKKENAKQHKLNSDESGVANIPRRAMFEKLGDRH